MQSTHPHIFTLQYLANFRFSVRICVVRVGVENPYKLARSQQFSATNSAMYFDTFIVVVIIVNVVVIVPPLYLRLHTSASSLHRKFYPFCKNVCVFLFKRKEKLPYFFHSNFRLYMFFWGEIVRLAKNISYCYSESYFCPAVLPLKAFLGMENILVVQKASRKHWSEEEMA